MQLLRVQGGRGQTQGDAQARGIKVSHFQFKFQLFKSFNFFLDIFLGNSWIIVWLKFYIIVFFFAVNFNVLIIFQIIRRKKRKKKKSD